MISKLFLPARAAGRYDEYRPLYRLLLRVSIFLMAKFTTTGNIALFEFIPCDNIEFDLSDDGILFVFGYLISGISAAKRYELNIKNYKVLGLYDEVKNKIQGINLEFIVKKENINPSNCVIFGKHAAFNRF